MIITTRDGKSLTVDQAEALESILDKKVSIFCLNCKDHWSIYDYDTMHKMEKELDDMQAKFPAELMPNFQIMEEVFAEASNLKVQLFKAYANSFDLNKLKETLRCVAYVHKVTFVDQCGNLVKVDRRRGVWTSDSLPGMSWTSDEFAEFIINCQNEFIDYLRPDPCFKMIEEKD